MLPRLKFEIDALVNTILDEVDQSIFSSATSTFLDPAMGGGQFIFQIISRLKTNGHSNENIKSRVFGYEDNPLYVSYVAQRYLMEHGEEIPATLVVGGLDTIGKISMKFDLCLGNPPYQAPTESDKGNTQGGFWSKFLKLSIENLNDGGYIGFVSPHSWIGMGGYNTPSFKLNTFKEYDVLSIDFDCRKHFPGIGIDICSYTIRKTRTNTETQIKTVNEKFAVDLKSLKAMPYQVSYLSIQILNKLLTANAGKSYSFSEGFDKNAGKPKVYVLSSRFGSLKFIRIDWTGDTQDKYRISMPINQSDVGCESYFQSKLFAFYFKIAGGESGMSQTGILQNAPVIDLSKTWTDEEIYEHFGLTEEEIEYIEASVA